MLATRRTRIFRAVAVHFSSVVQQTQLHETDGATSIQIFLDRALLEGVAGSLLTRMAWLCMTLRMRLPSLI